MSRSARTVVAAVLTCLLTYAPVNAAERSVTVHPKAKPALSASAAAADGTDAEVLNLDAGEIAKAMNDQAGLVTGASFPIQASETSAGVSQGETGRFMPVQGTYSAALSSGQVSLFERTTNEAPNTTTSFGNILRGGLDVTTLKVDLNLPAGDNCLAFNTVFYSEEYPEFVGSSYNDAFIAELGTSDWSVSGSAVTAPNNFASDENGNALTVNSASFASDEGTGLEFDGSTKLLTVRTPITGGQNTSLYLSIFDVGDARFDSAVLMDRLRTYKAAAGECVTGADLDDSDGDGLLDDWETNGLDSNEDGAVDVDLPAMGANPKHKDLFVELDSMKGKDGHPLKLSSNALKTVTDSFAAAPVSNPDGTTGIRMHVDNGPDSVMNPVTGAKWGSLSKANDDIPFQDKIAQDGWWVFKSFKWDKFDSDIKNKYFDGQRAPAFRYAVSANRFNDDGNSGIARVDNVGKDAGSDFLVTLGGFCAIDGKCGPAGPGSHYEQAGTFMHELGHTLGLSHGGSEADNNVNYKPNYLSIMNYTFQLNGLDGGPRKFDFSRYGDGEIRTLDEGDLDETQGIAQPSAASALNGFKTVIFCKTGGFLGIGETTNERRTSVAPRTKFNCDDDTDDTDVSEDINDGAGSELKPYDDWAAVKLRGGAIGGFGLSALLPSTTEINEATRQELEAVARTLMPPMTASAPAAADIPGGVTLTSNIDPNQHTNVQVSFVVSSAASGEQQTDWQPFTATVSAPATQNVALSPGRYTVKAAARSDASQVISTTTEITVAETAGPTGPAPVTGAGPQPSKKISKAAAKMAVKRASVDREKRQVDVLAPISGLASGKIKGQFQAAGKTAKFTANVDSKRRRIKATAKVTAKQASKGQGILTLEYAGDDDTQPQTVRLRAASDKAQLKAGRPKITVKQLTASGKISKRARGTVRVQLVFETAAGAQVAQYTAKIKNGKYKLSVALPDTVAAQIAARTGVLHAYTLFTGYEKANMRGEMASHEVLAAP